MKHVISGSGAHRIEWGSIAGELVPYQQIARLEADGRVFCATTEYWAGVLPPFFEVKPVAYSEEYRKEGITEADKAGLQASLAMISHFITG